MRKGLLKYLDTISLNHRFKSLDFGHEIHDCVVIYMKDSTKTCYDDLKSFSEKGLFKCISIISLNHQFKSLDLTEITRLCT